MGIFGVFRDLGIFGIFRVFPFFGDCVKNGKIGDFCKIGHFLKKGENGEKSQPQKKW